MVQHDQIPAHEIEPVQLVTGLLGVRHLVVDHKGRAFGVGRAALANLTDRSEFGEQGKQVGGREIVGEIFNEEDADDQEGGSAWGQLGCGTEDGAYRFASGASLLRDMASGRLGCAPLRLYFVEREETAATRAVR